MNKRQICNIRKTKSLMFWSHVLSRRSESSREWEHLLWEPH